MSATRPLAAAHRSRDTELLDIARIADRTEVLGPGVRSVVWVQGCALRCRGCVVPESHAFDTGKPLTPAALADRLVRGHDSDGVVFSGGEPFLQARGLAATIALLRRRRPQWTYVSYSGYRIETLRARGTPDQRTLLSELDLLIDGPYVRSLAGDLLWRGSSNQRLHALTPEGARAVAGRGDRSAGVELTLDDEGRLAWNGVAPPDFRARLDAALARSGLHRLHGVTGTDQPRQGEM